MTDILFYLLLSIIIFVLLIVILFHKKYWLLFLLLILSILLNYSLGINIFGLLLTSQKIGMIIALSLLFPLFLSIKYPISNLKTPFTLPLLFLIIIASISSLFAKYPEASYEGIITLLLIFIAIHILYFLINISDPRRVRQVLTLGISCIFILILGLSILQFIRKGELIGRMTGTFRNPNEFGAMILMILPVILAGMEGEDTKLVWLGAIASVLSFIAIYLSYSRATYLATIFFIGIIIVGNSIFTYQKKSIILNKKMWISISIIVLMGLYIYYVVPLEFFQYGAERYQSVIEYRGLSLEASSINKRYNAIWLSLKFFRENPLLGIGIKNFNAYSSHLFGAGNIPATENTYLNLLSELGLLGFFIFIYIIFKVFRTLIENQREIKTSYLKCLNKYLIYGYITLLFLMGTNDFLDDLRVFWVLPVVIISLKDLDKRLIMYYGESEEKLP